jgi:glycosyltransferase involved in cell wall biosynthesis
VRPVRPGPPWRLLFVGKDFYTKGGDLVVRALPRIREELGQEVSLTVVGPTTWPMPHPPGPGVHFLGRLPSARVAELWAEHDAFVMPSRLEGFGIAFVEALSAGLPCVGHRAFAMPEIIEDGVSGRLVDRLEPDCVAEAVCQVLGDPQLWTTVGNRVEATRRYYSWDRAATDMVEVLRAVTGAR